MDAAALTNIALAGTAICSCLLFVTLTALAVSAVRLDFRAVVRIGAVSVVLVVLILAGALVLGSGSSLPVGWSP